VAITERSDRIELAAAWIDALCRRSVLMMPVVVLLGLGVRVTPAPGLREDEVQCEEAVAHVQSCCSTFTSNVSCTFVDRGACEASTYPDFTPDESRRVQALACHEVVDSGLCSFEFDHSVSTDEGF
jgi:hypothetical protein